MLVVIQLWASGGRNHLFGARCFGWLGSKLVVVSVGLVWGYGPNDGVSCGFVISVVDPFKDLALFVPGGGTYYLDEEVRAVTLRTLLERLGDTGGV